MLTSKGSTYTSLLDVQVYSGLMTVNFVVPIATKAVDVAYVTTMIPRLNDKIASEKKPGGTYEACLSRIEHHREQLQAAYMKLFATYERDIAPPVGRNVAAADKARMAMLTLMGDKMLRAYAEHVGCPLVEEYILPDDREELLQVVCERLKEQVEAVGSGA